MPDLVPPLISEIHATRRHVARYGYRRLRSAAAAGLMTLISNCRVAEVDPAASLEDVEVRCAGPGGARSVADLVPLRWKQLREAEIGPVAAPAAA